MVIPKDFEEKALGELLLESPRNGLTKPKAIRGKGTKMVGMGELFAYPHIKAEEMERVPVTKTEMKNYCLQNYDLLFARQSLVLEGAGKCSIIEEISEPTVFESHLIRVRIDEQMADPHFVFYWFNSSTGRQVLLSLISRVAAAGVRSSELVKIKMPLPPIDEQHAIADALSDMDALIDSLEKLIAKKQAIKQGAMQELLTGRRRLKGFSGEWKTVRLLDIIELLNGLTYTPHNIKDTGTLVLRSSNIQNGKIVFNDNVFVDVVVDEVKTVHKNDIVICVRNGSAELLGKCAMVEKNYSNITFGAFMAVLRGKSAPFIYQLLSMGNIQKDILRNSNSTINQITNSDFASIYVSVPSDKEEQQAIAQTLSDMDDDISALQAKLDKYRRIKQGMMAELLSGRIRLN